MTPSIDERLASVVRALSDVVLPSLPAEAGLAQEQVQLSIGHLQILRAQLDAAPAYEAEELADAAALARALDACEGGRETQAAKATLAASLAEAGGAAEPGQIRNARIAVNAAIAALVRAASTDGLETTPSQVTRLVLEHEKRRVIKDRRWFAPFGFDSALAE